MVRRHKAHKLPQTPRNLGPRKLPAKAPLRVPFGLCLGDMALIYTAARAAAARAVFMLFAQEPGTLGSADLSVALVENAMRYFAGTAIFSCVFGLRRFDGCCTFRCACRKRRRPPPDGQSCSRRAGRARERARATNLQGADPAQAHRLAAREVLVHDVEDCADVSGARARGSQYSLRGIGARGRRAPVRRMV